MRSLMPVLFISAVLADGSAAAAGPEDVLTAFMTAFNARNAAQAASLYAGDGELMPPDGPPVKGRAAIEARYRTHFRQARVLDLLSVQSRISGDLAYVTGRLTVSTRTPQHGAEIAAGSYLVVLRRVDGAWRIAHHMFTLPLRPDYVG